MTATDEFRAMLDERGVKWRDDSSIYGTRRTVWMVDDVTFVAAEVSGRLKVSGYLTTEQAIAATLGAGTCHDLAETPVYRDKTEFKCSECGYEYSAVGGFGCDYGDEPDFNFCPNCGRKVTK